MHADDELHDRADRLAADLLRTTGSVLRLSLGTTNDFREPRSPGSHVEGRVVIGSGSVDEAVAAFNEPHPVVWVEVDGELVGGVGEGWPRTEEEFAMFVDQVQEQHLDEEIWGGWPFCPEHAAHLDCVFADGWAVWLCPRGEVVSRVGELPGSRRAEG